MTLLHWLILFDPIVMKPDPDQSILDIRESGLSKVNGSTCT